MIHQILITSLIIIYRCRLCPFRKELKLKNNGANIGKADGILLGTYEKNNRAIRDHYKQKTHTQTISQLKLMAVNLKQFGDTQVLSEQPYHEVASTNEMKLHCLDLV